MAGTLLLIAREKENKAGIRHHFDTLTRFVSDMFQSRFQHIAVHEFDEGALLVEFRKNDRNKFYTDGQGSWLTFEGTVFALDRTKALGPEELFELYKTDPLSFPNKLDGHYVIKLYDAARQKHLIINDILKNKINYITENERFIMITPLLLTAALIRRPEVDAEAYNEFMWRYYLLSRRSVLKDVSKLTEASVYEISRNAISRKSYWDWPQSYTTISFSEATDRMTESMKESARLVYETFGKPCIDFTMGQDTRQVLSAFRNQEIPLATSIFGGDAFYEAQQIKKVSRKHGIEHHNIQLREDYLDHLWDYFRKALELGSHEEPGHLLSRILYMRERQEEYGNVVCNGQEGHFYKNGLWDEMYTINFYREPEGFNKELFYRTRVLSTNYRDDMFTPEFRRVKEHSRDYFGDLIDEHIGDYLDRPVSMQVDKFDIYAWLNFENAANNTMNIIFDSMSPLYFRRNLQLALEIPVKWKFNLSKFQREVVHRLDPNLAGEKTDFGGVNMKPKNALTYIPFLFRYYYFQSNRLRKKILTRLGFRVITHLQEAWDYLPVYRDLFSDPQVQALFDKVDYLNQYIDPAELKPFLESMENPEQQTLKNYDLLLKLAGTEHFLGQAMRLWNAVSGKRA